MKLFQSKKIVIESPYNKAECYLKLLERMDRGNKLNPLKTHPFVPLNESELKFSGRILADHFEIERIKNRGTTGALFFHGYFNPKDDGTTIVMQIKPAPLFLIICVLIGLFLVIANATMIYLDISKGFKGRSVFSMSLLLIGLFSLRASITMEYDMTKQELSKVFGGVCT